MDSKVTEALQIFHDIILQNLQLGNFKSFEDIDRARNALKYLTGILHNSVIEQTQ